jgi:CheY-like chemotaxis protein
VKVEIRCPSCSRGYLIDEASHGAELMCPACFAPVSTQKPAEPRPAAAGPEAPAPSAQIVCPRCKLHFAPRQRTVNVQRERRQTVLVVEDMAYFRQIAEDALSPEYNVKMARTVAEAEAILDGGGIDLMVLDLTLEGGDEGRRLLEDPARKRCPILIFTAQDEAEMYGERWEELHRLGADDIVIKGMKVGESLVRKVGALLGGSLDEREAFG